MWVLGGKVYKSWLIHWDRWVKDGEIVYIKSRLENRNLGCLKP